MLKEKINELIVNGEIIKVIAAPFHYYPKEEIDKELRKEKVTNLSLEGLITEGLDFKNESFRIYYILYFVKTEDNKPLLFIEYHKKHPRTAVGENIYHAFNNLLDKWRDSLIELFEEEGNNNVKIMVTYCDERINNPDRDSKRLDEIHKYYLKKFYGKNKWLLRSIPGAIGVIGAGIVYATCFMPRTIEDAKVVSIKQEEVINVKAGSVSKWYKINVDKHDDCLIMSEEIGTGLKVGGSLKEIKWKPQMGECDYVISYEK